MKKKILSAAILLALTSSVVAHDWYSGYENEKKENCCGGNDCAQLPDGATRAVSGGYIVTFLPPGFPNASGIKLPVFIPNTRAQPGEDPVHYHMCIYANEVRCFFYPAPGF